MQACGRAQVGRGSLGVGTTQRAGIWACLGCPRPEVLITLQGQQRHSCDAASGRRRTFHLSCRWTWQSPAGWMLGKVRRSTQETPQWPWQRGRHCVCGAALGEQGTRGTRGPGLNLLPEVFPDCHFPCSTERGGPVLPHSAGSLLITHLLALLHCESWGSLISVTQTQSLDGKMDPSIRMMDGWVEG